MEIRKITENKKDYLDMLLIADPQEDMIDKYLEASDMFVLMEAGAVFTIGVVQMLGNRRCELKNLVTVEEYQGRGYGKYMIRYICEHYSGVCDTIYVGTGNSPQTLEFYKKCGFVNSHIEANFFTDYYREPIYENGMQLIDMIYLKKELDAAIDVKKVVNLALDAGRILLKNGGEIFRVEETMKRICSRFHVDNVDIFTISHAIFISAENESGSTYMKVKHVPFFSSHLGIVAEVNALSREISAGHVDLEEAVECLKQIEQLPANKESVQVLAAGTASGMFAVLLGSTIMEGIGAFFIGCLTYIWVLFAVKHNLSNIIKNMIGGVVITLVAVLLMQIPGLPVLQIDGMIIGAIMPLIPGVAFVNAIRDIANTDFLAGTVRMIDAILNFVYIAVGVGVTLSIYNGMIGGLVI